MRQNGREDRSTGAKGGGVFILVKDTLVSSEQNQLKTDCEIIWVRIELLGSKPLYVASYYRPHEGDRHSLEEFRHSVELASKSKGNVWILGDFNFPKFSWSTDHMPSVKTGCSYTQLYDDFISILDDNSLVQMVDEPTRNDNILDLFLTDNPTLVSSVQVLPGIGDHNAVICEINTKARVSKTSPRNFLLYRKADWAGFEAYMTDSRDEILQSSDRSTVDEIWNHLKSKLLKGIETFIPSRKTPTKASLPWITQHIKRCIRKRDSLFQKYKKNKNPKIRKQFLDLKHSISRQIKESYNKYLEDILYITDSNDKASDNKKDAVQGKFSTKNFTP